MTILGKHGRPNSGYYFVAAPRARYRKTTGKEIVMSIDNDVDRDIVEYLRAHHGVEPDEITDESTLDDLGLESLGVLVIADIIENKYGVSLDDERIAGVRTFSDCTAHGICSSGMMALKNACLQVAIGEKRNAISVASDFDLDHDGLILGAGERPVVGALPFALT